MERHNCVIIYMYIIFARPVYFLNVAFTLHSFQRLTFDQIVPNGSVISPNLVAFGAY